MTKPPRKPAKRYPGIQARLMDGRWMWRARLRVGDSFIVGRYRETQEDASDDHRLLREQRKKSRQTARPRDGLQACFDAVLERAKKRRDPDLVEQDTGGATRFITTKIWSPDTPIERIDAREFDFFVTKCLEAGRHPSTIRRYVQILNKARAVAGLEPIKPDIPRGERRPMEFFKPEELREVLHKMRTAELPPGPDQSEKAVAIATFVAMTGIRGGEFIRLRASDIDLKRGEITIVAKDRSNPRRVPITAPLRPVVTELLRHATEDGRLISSLSAWRSMWRRWSERLGVSINGRKLRHTFVTSALYSGLSVTEARDLAGHKHLATTDRYAHEITSRMHDAALRAQSFLSATAHGDPGDDRERQEQHSPD